MQKLTDVGQNLVNDIAARYGLSHDAVVHMLIAVNNGGGSMAQFNCPELGGSGQWMRGGMTMAGDMFNYALKNTIDNLCNELSAILANHQIFPVIPAGTPESNRWWPVALGTPFSSGAQNNTRYAIFPNRLAVEVNGQVAVYDTLDHNISGVSQQQGGNTSLTFNSQWGTISVTSLPLISGQTGPEPANQNFAQPENNSPEQPSNQTQYQSNASEPTNNQSQQQNNASEQSSNLAPPANNISEGQAILASTNVNGNDAPQYTANQTLEIIEKLAHLRDLGALTDDEYNSKKADLLARI